MRAEGCPSVRSAAGMYGALGLTIRLAENAKDQRSVTKGDSGGLQTSYSMKVD